MREDIKELTTSILEYTGLDISYSCDAGMIFEVYETLDAIIEEDGNNTRLNEEIDLYDDTWIRIVHTDYIDEVWEEKIEDTLRECMDIPDRLLPYIDFNKWVQDCKADGRGHELNYVDGTELICGDYHIYKM